MSSTMVVLLRATVLLFHLATRKHFIFSGVVPTRLYPDLVFGAQKQAPTVTLCEKLI